MEQQDILFSPVRARCYPVKIALARRIERLEKFFERKSERRARRVTRDCLLYLLIDKCALVLGSDKTDYNENVVAIKENGRRTEIYSAASERKRILCVCVCSQPPAAFILFPDDARKREFSAPSRHRARVFISSMDGWMSG